MSQQQEFLRLAYEKGYRVSRDGSLVTNLIGKLIKLHKDASNYLRFTLNTKGKAVSVPVHRLQAYQKFGEKLFDKGIVVRHLNENSLDNAHSNILIGTHSDNVMDMPKHKRIKRASNPAYNHKDIVADRIKGMTYKQIMIKHAIPSKGTVSYIINKSLESQNI